MDPADGSSPRAPYRLALHAFAMVHPHPLANPGSALDNMRRISHWEDLTPTFPVLPLSSPSTPALSDLPFPSCPSP